MTLNITFSRANWENGGRIGVSLIRLDGAVIGQLRCDRLAHPEEARRNLWRADGWGDHGALNEIAPALRPDLEDAVRKALV